MADVTLIQAGRWGFSRIVQLVNGGWTTAAMRQVISQQGIEAFYPPLVAGAYPVPFAMIRLRGAVDVAPNADTTLLPSVLLASELTLGDLTTAQRNNLRNFLSTSLTAYSFTDWDGALRSVPTFDVTGYTTTTLLRDVLRDVFRYLGHSTSRPKPSVPETHNTEATDDFSTDPFSAPRWTNELNTAVWDSTNLELDMDMATSAVPGCRYSTAGPGSIEHEAQVTSVWQGSAGNNACGAGVRMDNTGADDWYFCSWTANTMTLQRVNAGTETELTTFTFTMTANDFVTHRMAAAGAVGANVALSIWRTSHGASKPTDPGWYGTDGSPDHTNTDSAVDRLDNATSLHCGITGMATGSDYDTRSDFYKQRAISDRSAAAAAGADHGFYRGLARGYARGLG